MTLNKPTDIIAGLDLLKPKAKELGRPMRTWLARIKAYSHWVTDYTAAAKSGGIMLNLAEAAEQTNAWLDEIDCV